MEFKLSPYPHQHDIFGRAEKETDLAMLWEMGTGKTGAAINILRMRFAAAGKMKRTLIVSPLVTLFNWKEEFKLHSYINQSDIHVIHGASSKKKIKLLNKVILDQVTMAYDRDAILIINYESFRSAAVLEIIQEWNPEYIIADEAHLIKNPKAQCTKTMIKLGDKSEENMILTGTLILNSVKDIFAPFRFLDGGETFGRNFHVFLNKYMEDENASWSNKPGHFPSLVAKTDTFDELNTKIFTKASRILKKDVLKDLPPFVRITRHVELGKEQAKYYKEMERDFVTFVQEKKKSGEQSGAVIAQLAVTKALRLQQIASGYVSTDEGEEIFIEDNPRLRETEVLLKEIVVDGKHKCILWCSFKANYIMLANLCDDLKIGYSMLTGQQNLKEKQESMVRFNTDSSCQVIIANRRAGGIGVNLVAASYSIVYSRNFSLGEELQSEARNYRGGSQIHTSITKIDLAARGTVDELTLECLKNKEDLSKSIIDIAGMI